MDGGVGPVRKLVIRRAIWKMCARGVLSLLTSRSYERRLSSCRRGRTSNVCPSLFGSWKLSFTSSCVAWSFANVEGLTRRCTTSAPFRFDELSPAKVGFKGGRAGTRKIKVANVSVQPPKNAIVAIRFRRMRPAPCTCSSRLTFPVGF